MFSTSSPKSPLIDRTRDVLNKLQGSPQFVFFLTGSRYFGNYSEKSDYDFFVNDLPGVRDFLDGLGLRPTALDLYSDRDIIYLREGHNVHVQIVRDAQKKDLVQQALLQLKIFGLDITSLPKNSQSDVWETLFNLVYEDSAY